MAMASLNASLLAAKGGAHPAANSPRYLTSVRTPAFTIPKPNKTATGSRKTKKKSLRLDVSMDRDLRLLAVRLGLSQQALMELAIADYVEKAFAAGECVCQRR